MSYTCFVFFQNDFESLGMVLKKGCHFISLRVLKLTYIWPKQFISKVSIII